MNNYDLIPPIRRARGYRLYAEGGVRYLDMWQQDGRAICGHAPVRVRRAFENALARGQGGVLPGRWRVRLERALSTMTGAPGPWGLYGSAEAAHTALDRAFGRAGWGLADPVDESHDEGVAGVERVELFRPLLSTPETGRSDPLLVQVPVMVGSGVYALWRPDAATPQAPIASPLPGMGQPPSEPVLAAATRAAYDSVEQLERLHENEAVCRNVFAAFDRAPTWKRRGLYVRSLLGTDDYCRLFARFLDANVVLSPEVGGVSIVPLVMSAGEQALIVRLVGETEA